MVNHTVIADLYAVVTGMNSPLTILCTLSDVIQIENSPEISHPRCSATRANLVGCMANGWELH